MEREYFIAAEEAQWDYAPSGRDGLTGMEFNTSVSDMDMQHGMSADHEAGTWTLQSSNRYKPKHNPLREAVVNSTEH